MEGILNALERLELCREKALNSVLLVANHTVCGGFRRNSPIRRSDLRPDVAIYNDAIHRRPDLHRCPETYIREETMWIVIVAAGAGYLLGGFYGAAWAAGVVVIIGLIGGVVATMRNE